MGDKIVIKDRISKYYLIVNKHYNTLIAELVSLDEAKSFLNSLYNPSLYSLIEITESYKILE